MWECQELSKKKIDAGFSMRLLVYIKIIKEKNGHSYDDILINNSKKIIRWNKQTNREQEQ